MIADKIEVKEFPRTEAVGSPSSTGTVSKTLRPRSAILTLYGDYVRQRGGQIWTGSLLQLLGNFGLSAPTLRLALSRMLRQGLLHGQRSGRRSYYSLTALGQELLAQGVRRVFQESPSDWDGAWYLVTYSVPEGQRTLRDHLRQELIALGFGQLGPATWLSPHDRSTEVTQLALSLGLQERIQAFRARHDGLADPQALVARCWDLAKTNQKHAEFLALHQPRLEEHRRSLEQGEVPSPQWCFVERFLLIHDYRRHRFYDPQLPPELLPERWLGSEAQALFSKYYDLLAEPAQSYVDSLFQRCPGELGKGSPIRTGV